MSLNGRFVSYLLIIVFVAKFVRTSASPSGLCSTLIENALKIRAVSFTTNASSSSRASKPCNEKLMIIIGSGLYSLPLAANVLRNGVALIHISKSVPIAVDEPWYTSSWIAPFLNKSSIKDRIGQFAHGQSFALERINFGMMHPRMNITYSDKGAMKTVQVSETGQVEETAAPALDCLLSNTKSSQTSWCFRASATGASPIEAIWKERTSPSSVGNMSLYLSADKRSIRVIRGADEKVVAEKEKLTPLISQLPVFGFISYLTDTNNKWYIEVNVWDVHRRRVYQWEQDERPNDREPCGHFPVIDIIPFEKYFICSEADWTELVAGSHPFGIVDSDPNIQDDHHGRFSTQDIILMTLLVVGLLAGLGVIGFYCILRMNRRPLLSSSSINTKSDKSHIRSRTNGKEASLKDATTRTGTSGTSGTSKHKSSQTSN